MHLVAIGVNHNTAPVSLRERVAVAERELPAMLSRLFQEPVVSEAVILSTCNRTEVYCAIDTDVDDRGEDAVIDFLAEVNHTGRALLDDHLYTYTDGAAVAHLMNVASGLDSMILGEYQILGQVKNAYGAAQQAKTAGPLLNHLFQGALAAGKRVRTETEIGYGTVSVGAAAVELATQIFGESLAGHSVLVLGAGKMSDLTARHLQSRGAPSVMVTNRTFERAEELARQLGGGAQAKRYDDLPACLVTSDIVICSTAAPHPVVTKAMIQAAMKARRNRALFLIDIAVPRDVEASVSDIENVYLFNIDDLKQVVSDAQKQRYEEVESAQQIAESAVQDFLIWWRSLDVAPLVVAVRQHLESIRIDEIAKLRAKSSGLTERELKVVEATMRSYTQKLAHSATEAIKSCVGAEGELAYERLEAIRMAFGLEAKQVEETFEK